MKAYQDLHTGLSSAHSLRVYLWSTTPGLERIHPTYMGTPQAGIMQQNQGIAGLVRCS